MRHLVVFLKTQFLHKPRFPRPKRRIIALSRWISSGLTGLLLSSSIAWATEPPHLTIEQAVDLSIEDLLQVQIATGQPKSMQTAPAIATVITAADLRALGAADIDDALEGVPGLHVSRSGRNYTPIYQFRGMHSPTNSRVLMMINGLPINQILFGGHALSWGGMPIEAIKRIEIIRGPGSALYGADAFAGVINVITKSGADITRSELGVRSGSFDTHEGWAIVGDTWQDFEIAAIVQFSNTDGDNNLIEADVQTRADTMLGTSASRAPDSVSTSHQNVDFNLDMKRGPWQLRGGLQRRRNLGYGAGIEFALDPEGRTASDRINLDLGWHDQLPNSDWDLSARVSLRDQRFWTESVATILPAGTVVPIGPGSRVFSTGFTSLASFPDGVLSNISGTERHTRLDLSGMFSGWKKHVISLGAGYNKAEISSIVDKRNFGAGIITGTEIVVPGTLTEVTDPANKLLPEHTRRNWYAYSQDEWSVLPNVELTTGLRYDYYSDFDSTINPRLALVWTPQPKLSVKLLAGRAFRAPSAVELHTNQPTLQGNPNLKPETIETYEAGIDMRPSQDLHFAANVYYYHRKNIIQSTPDSTGLFTSQNLDDDYGRGIEIEADWWVTPRLHLLANGALHKVIKPDPRSPAEMAPGQEFTFAANWHFARGWSLVSTLNAIGNRNRNALDTRSSIDDYTKVDFALHKRVFDQLEVSAGLRNAFDSDIREPAPINTIANDLPMPGRQLWLELRFFLDQ